MIVRHFGHGARRLGPRRDVTGLVTALALVTFAAVGGCERDDAAASGDETSATIDDGEASTAEAGDDASVEARITADEAGDGDVTLAEDGEDDVSTGDAPTAERSRDVETAAADDERVTGGQPSPATAPEGTRSERDAGARGRRAGDRASAPSATGDTIEVRPSAPSSDDSIRVRAGPLTFNNGCEGIERSTSRGPNAAGNILVGWQPRRVSPEQMCTQALHDMWIEVDLGQLEPGEYTLEVAGIGRKKLEVTAAK